MDEKMAETNRLISENKFGQETEKQWRTSASQCGQGCWSWVRANLLMVLTVIGIVVGIALGFGLHPYNLSDEAILIIGLPGDVFIRLLKMLILPLIVTSLITGTAGLDARSNARLGIRAIGYYLTTTLIAATIGLVCVLTIKPGRFAAKPDSGGHEPPELQASALDAILDIIRNIFPDNLMQACFQQVQTYYTTENITERILVNTSEQNLTYMYLNSSEDNSSAWQTIYLGTEQVRQLRYVNNMNVLGLIFFCILFGVLLGAMESEGKVVVDFFTVVGNIVIKMVMGVMWYSPIGILSLICAMILDVEDPVAFFSMLAMLVVTSLLALTLHTIALIVIYFVFTRKNILEFYQKVAQALLTAFATQSSSATLPVTFRCVEDNLGVDKRVSRFMLPIGSIVNMDGTALYEAVAAIFIAQLNRIDINFAQIIIIVITAILASIGAASIPSAGLVTMLMVLTAAGLPTEDVALLLTIDWFMDRCRTTVNVMGDCFGASIVHHLLRDDLEEFDQKKRETRDPKERASDTQSQRNDTETSFMANTGANNGAHPS